MDAKRNEEGRWQVLRYLYNRIPNALSAESILDGLQRTGFPATTAEVGQWLAFWADFQPQPAVKITHPAWGATQYYNLTSAGVVLVEVQQQSAL